MNNEQPSDFGSPINQSSVEIKEPQTSVTCSFYEVQKLTEGLNSLLVVQRKVALDYKAQLVTCRKLRQQDQAYYESIRDEKRRQAEDLVKLGNQVELLKKELKAKQWRTVAYKSTKKTTKKGRK